MSIPKQRSSKNSSKRSRNLLLIVLVLSTIGSLYYGLQLERTQDVPVSLTTLLTPNEQEWLSNHPVIKVGVDPDFLPLEGYNSKGEYVGMAAEYLDILERILNVKLQIVPNLTWSEVLEGSKNGTVELVSCLGKSAERDEYLDFTSPYLEFPAVIITRNSVRGITGIDSLFDKNTTVVQDYWIHSLLRVDYPKLGLKTYPTGRQCMESVSFGENDAYISDLASASYLMGELGLSNLRIAAYSPYSLALRMGVPHGNPELLSIMDKALTAIPEYRKDEIFTKWIRINQQSFFETKEFWYTIAGAGFFLILNIFFVFWYNRSISNQLENRTESLINTENALKSAETKLEKLLLHTSDSVVLLNATTGLFVEANPAFYRTFNRSPDEVIGHTGDEFGLWETLETRTRLFNQIQQGRQLLRELVVWQTRSHVRKKGYLTSEVVELHSEKYIMFIWSSSFDKEKYT